MNKQISRRTFLKTSAVLGNSLVLAGCVKKPATELQTISTPAESDSLVSVATTAPHNCGGACALRVLVDNNVVKRILTDESKNDENLVDALYYNGTGKGTDSPQERACVRCHAQKSWYYDANRLLYPLKQTKERGDISGFVRISWAEATRMIKEKFEENRKKYGFGAFHYIYGTGASGPRANITAFSGGGMGYRQDYSFPASIHVANFVIGEGYAPRGNSRTDGVNADEIICWSHNVGETFMGTNSMWYLTQFRDMGVRVKVIDQQISKTAATIIKDIAKDYMAPVSGTDAAVMFALMHSILKDHIEEFKKLWGAQDAAALKAKVGEYVHGFFDDKNASSYHADIDNTAFQKNYTAKNGTSLSAYVFGTSDYLVKLGLNDAVSAYPENIGYNIWGHSDKRDLPSAQTMTKCYGQTEKTPEWAEKISGVPARQIREWAKDLITKKTTIWLGAGLQRNSESEQPIMAILALAGITKSFGASGQACGWYYTGRGADCLAGNAWAPKISAGNYQIDSELSQFYSNNPDSQYKYIDPETKGVDYGALNFYDTGKLSFPDKTSKFCRAQIPVFMWLDAVEATNKPKVKDVDGKTDVWPSKWNDGQVKRLPVPWKVLINTNGNIIVNQNGDPNYAAGILKNRGNLDFILSFDVVMTPSAQYSDLVIPSAMGGETEYDAAPFWESFNVSRGEHPGASKYLIANKAVNPPGEAISALKFQALVAKEFGREDDFYNGIGNYDNFEANIVKANYEQNAKRAERMSFKEWKEKGVYRADPSEYTQKIWGKDFRDDPAANALATVSGRIEAYCHSQMEDYEARHYANIDPKTSLRKGAAIYSPGTSGAQASQGRFVYPIPMYIPLIEGQHADNSHPDVLKLGSKGYDKRIHTWHIMYRSHSTFNSNPLLNDFYKKDKNGNFAHLKRSSTNTNEEQGAPAVWHDDVYETVWVNPDTAYSGSKNTMKDGDMVIIESLRGKIKCAVRTTQRVRKDVIMIGQGSWYFPDADGVDIGGNANTLMSLRPSRICQGMTLANDCRVKIYKA